MSSRVRAHATMSAGRPRWRATRIARSSATQHIRREYVNSCRPPRTSQIPSSGLVPVLETQSTISRQVHPGVVGDRPAVLVVEVDRVDQLAVDVELELLRGAVSDPHGRGAAVAREMVERLLLEVGAAVDPVHHLQRAADALAALAEAVGQPVPERARLLDEPEPEQREHA